MCWAFRDVWESLYQRINLLFIDELMDNGLDTQGVESGLALLKKMSRERHKSIWLVSHRDELAGRVSNILKVTKENGFTSSNLSLFMLGEYALLHFIKMKDVSPYRGIQILCVLLSPDKVFSIDVFIKGYSYSINFLLKTYTYE
jgi:energy-coupling factor transporter ATP-binding protein EcfA2